MTRPVTRPQIPLQNRPSSTPTRRLTAVTAALATAVAGAIIGTAAVGAPAQADPATPRNFTGFGFDQCVAPTQKSMNTWLRQSPFLAAGIYISGDSRACRTQPNLSPEWVAAQVARGWRLLPIALGPQASCQPSFPRYGNVGPASIPITLAEEQATLNRGDRVLLMGVGSGLNTAMMELAW